MYLCTPDTEPYVKSMCAEMRITYGYNINDVQVAVLKKSLDTLESNGDGLTKMMEASVTPNLGQNIDIRV